MCLRIALCSLAFLSLAISNSSAQHVQVSRTNKTIQVTASTTLKVDPEMARLRFGFKNYGATQQTASDENVQSANKITKALQDGGVPKDAIETETIKIGRSRDAEYGVEKTTVPEFIAVQEWTVITPVSEADKALQTAIRAGANMVQEVEWIVNNPEELSAKAISSALQRARLIAVQIAKETGAKTGDLLYISNSEPEQITRFDRRKGAGMAYAMAPPPAPLPLPLHLFPAKVEQSATVTAVFAIE